MNLGKPKTVMYRRKREGRTSYPLRRRLLLSGKPRLVVRFTNTKILGQIITFHPQGDKVEAAVDSSGLRKLGWTFSCRCLPAAYLTGYWLGKKAAGKEAVLDTGFSTPHRGGRWYAFLRGAVEGGLQVPHDPVVFPPLERLESQQKKGTIEKGTTGAQDLKTAQVRKVKEALSHHG